MVLIHLRPEGLHADVRVNGPNGLWPCLYFGGYLTGCTCDDLLREVDLRNNSLTLLYFSNEIGYPLIVR